VAAIDAQLRHRVSERAPMRSVDTANTCNRMTRTVAMQLGREKTNSAHNLPGARLLK
jgi:hypothetical protein